MVNLKFRESGMPIEDMWDTFFDPAEVLTRLEVNKESKLLIEVGCGYGTFLIPAAKWLNKGTVIGIDVDPEMVNICQQKVGDTHLENVELLTSDIFTDGYMLEHETADGVFLFNILHCENPSKLLKDTYNVLRANSNLYVIHWNYDDSTPRGPSLTIRPKPEQIILWALNEGFRFEKNIEVGQYHYGLVFAK